MEKKRTDPAASPSPRLEDFLCFAVYSANLAFGRAYKAILEDLGVTYTQWIVIVALWEQDRQTVTSLGDKLFLESNTLTPILKKLEAMGYLRRERDRSDERQVLVTLTDAGRRLREKGRHRDLVAATGLSAEEFRTLQKAVVRMRGNLILHAQEPTSDEAVNEDQAARDTSRRTAFSTRTGARSGK